YRDCFAEQPAELLGGDRLDVVLCEVHLDELGEGQAAWDPLLTPDAVKRTLERVGCVAFAREAASLDALRVAAAGAVAVSPLRLPIPPRALELEHLALLHGSPSPVAVRIAPYSPPRLGRWSGFPKISS